MAGAEVFKAGYVINDRFEIKRLLGQGGFAMVFEGTDRNLGRQVAIKILHGAVLASSAEDHRVIERFEREAKLAASVDHPSVVNIYDAGEIDALGEPFIVMEYLKGESLQDHLDAHGAMDASKLLPLFKDVLMGLGYAHELGIVHKDLKPDNIFYRYPGTMRESLCIVDFGIAHIGRSNSGRVTRDGEFFGTPSYMPPEYISEQKVSPGFDVYQMGLILIECLTGQSVVYHEDAVATLLKHLNRQFRIPRALLESEVWPVLERALAADTKVRYPNALAFAEALQAVPLSAWPSRQELTVGIVRDELELPTVNGELGDTETDVEDAFAEAWKQEESFRTRSVKAQDTLSNREQHEPDTPPSRGTGAQQSAALIAASSPSSSMEMSWPSDRSSGMMYAAENSASKNSLGAIIGFIAVLILVAGGIVMVLLNRPPTPGAPEVAAVASQDGEPASVKSEVTGATPEVVEPVEVVHEEPLPKQVEQAPIEVMIAGEPRGATIKSASGEVLGVAPLKMSFASIDSQSRSVTISLEDYEELDLDVSPRAASAGGVQYTLKKVVRGKGRSAKKEQRKKIVKVEEPKPPAENTAPAREEKKTAEVKIELPDQKPTTPAQKKESVSTQGIILPR